MGHREYTDEPAGRRRSLFDPLGIIADVMVPPLSDALDVDDVVRRMDVDDIVRRIDVDEVMRRIDVDEVMRRIDVDEVMRRIDVDAFVERLDIERLVQRADLAGIISQSTRGITANTIDLARRQIAGLDEIVTRVAARLVRHDPSTDPEGPPALLDKQPSSPRRSRGRPSITGHYAGPIARLAAFALDLWTVVFAFGAFTALGSWMFNLLFSGHRLDITLAPIWSAILLGGWTFLYFTVPLVLTGRTFGKAVLGLRVVRRDGTPLPARRVVVRVLVLPFSIAFLGLGLLGAVFGRQRRTLHDIAAGSVEVIDWGDRQAALPTTLGSWLKRRDSVSAGAQPGGVAKP